MTGKIFRAAALLLAVAFLAAGCAQQAPQTPVPTGTTATADLTKTVDDVKGALYKFGPSMRGVSDSFDNMYFAAKGGNWALAAYMGDIMGDYMEVTKVSKPGLYPQWDSFYKANLGDNSALRKAIAAGDFSAFDKAYTDTMNNGCNPCHAGNGFKFIRKIKAAAPEANLDYSVKSNASENK